MNFQRANPANAIIDRVTEINGSSIAEKSTINAAIIANVPSCLFVFFTFT